MDAPFGDTNILAYDKATVCYGGNFLLAKLAQYEEFILIEELDNHSFGKLMKIIKS